MARNPKNYDGAHFAVDLIGHAVGYAQRKELVEQGRRNEWRERDVARRQAAANDDQVRHARQAANFEHQRLLVEQERLAAEQSRQAAKSNATRTAADLALEIEALEASPDRARGLESLAVLEERLTEASSITDALGTVDEQITAKKLCNRGASILEGAGSFHGKRPLAYVHDYCARLRETLQQTGKKLEKIKGRCDISRYRGVSTAEARQKLDTLGEARLDTPFVDGAPELLAEGIRNGLLVTDAEGVIRPYWNLISLYPESSVFNESQPMLQFLNMRPEDQEAAVQARFDATRNKVLGACDGWEQLSKDLEKEYETGHVLSTLFYLNALGFSRSQFVDDKIEKIRTETRAVARVTSGIVAIGSIIAEALRDIHKVASEKNGAQAEADVAEVAALLNLDVDELDRVEKLRGNSPQLKGFHKRKKSVAPIIKKFRQAAADKDIRKIFDTTSHPVRATLVQIREHLAGWAKIQPPKFMTWFWVVVIFTIPITFGIAATKFPDVLLPMPLYFGLAVMAHFMLAMSVRRGFALDRYVSTNFAKYAVGLVEDPTKHEVLRNQSVQLAMVLEKFEADQLDTEQFMGFLTRLTVNPLSANDIELFRKVLRTYGISSSSTYQAAGSPELFSDLDESTGEEVTSPLLPAASSNRSTSSTFRVLLATIFGFLALLVFIGVILG